MSGADTRNILDMIGKTPLLDIGGFFDQEPGRILGKAEFLNPTGSVKDRMARYIIEDAERRGEIRPGDTIIDNSSGNTAVSVASVGAIKGYRTVFTVPDKTSDEKINLIRALGAEVVVCPCTTDPEDPDSYYSTARRLAQERGAFLVNQYHNPKNTEAYYHSLGPEIWEQTVGGVDHFIGGIGTGGTVSGTARFLKEKKPGVRVTAVDPVGSVLSDYIKTGSAGEASLYRVEGIGSDCIVEALDPSVIDDVVQADDDEAFDACRRFARERGIVLGGSTGSVLSAVEALLSRGDLGECVVTILPDSGIRYLSKIFC